MSDDVHFDPQASQMVSILIAVDRIINFCLFSDGFL